MTCEHLSCLCLSLCCVNDCALAASGGPGHCQLTHLRTFPVIDDVYHVLFCSFFVSLLSLSLSLPLSVCLSVCVFVLCMCRPSLHRHAHVSILGCTARRGINSGCWWCACLHPAAAWNRYTLSPSIRRGIVRLHHRRATVLSRTLPADHRQLEEPS
jgi:hypothetical protein